jgi:hypothetical protein
MNKILLSFEINILMNKKKDYIDQPKRSPISISASSSTTGAFSSFFCSTGAEAPVDPD